MSTSHDTSSVPDLAANFVVHTPAQQTPPSSEVPSNQDTGNRTPGNLSNLDPARLELNANDLTQNSRRLPRTEVWDVPFDRVTRHQALDHIEWLIRRGEPSYVITANLNYVMLHQRRPELQTVTSAAGLVVADGQPIVWRSKLGPDPLPERVAGSELIYDLARRASERGWGIYFLGGEPGVAARCAQRLADLYPGLQIAGVESPPYRELTSSEQAAQDARIGDSGAQLLLVALGQPKGECWIHQHYRRLGVPVCIQLGASFDFVAGSARRAPLLWQKVGLEWGYRMLSDPRRLVPRYAANTSFLIASLAEDWKRKVTSWGMGDWSRDRSVNAGLGPRRGAVRRHD